MNQHPILWQSKEVNPNSNESYLTIKQAKGYYYYAERAGKDSVAFILIDRNREDCIGVLNEPKPPIGDDVFLTTAFGGSLDKPISLNKIVQEEVKEEAGYTVPLSTITYLNKVFVSTQMNQFCHLYAVDVTNYLLGTRNLEEHESESSVKWIGPEALLNLQDWKAPLIYMKYIKENSYNQL